MRFGTSGLSRVLLKVTFLIAFCGGPMLLAGILGPILGKPWALLTPMAPLLLMLLGALSFQDPGGAFERWSVRLGLGGALVNLGMQTWGAAHLLIHPPAHGGGLHWTGIAMGYLAGGAYLFLALRWPPEPVPEPAVAEVIQAYRPPTTALVCKVSRLRAAGLFFLCTAVVAVSAFCTTLPGLGPKVAGWAGVGFFSLGFVAIPAQALRRGPQVVVDAVGIEDRRIGIGVIPWAEIEALSVGDMHGTRLLAVHLREDSPVLERLSPAQRRVGQMNAVLGYPPITLGFVGLEPGMDAVLAHLGLEP
jgi:hypothetical protein